MILHHQVLEMSLWEVMVTEGAVRLALGCKLGCKLTRGSLG
jgi:hypothetical protein